jgi:RNA polymerase sigma-70 factor (ECF subfamily)
MSKESGAGGDERVEAGLFAPTHWSLVLRARDKSETALGSLCSSYRQPLLVWLRSRNNTPHDAEDLVQGFLTHMLRGNFLSNVAKEKGKFRTFLLRCLKNYLSDQRELGQAAKRGGGKAQESLDELTEDGQRICDPAAGDAAPDLEYDRAWARTVLSNALRRLEAECARQGHAALCTALQPILFAEETASPYREIGTRLGMSEDAVKVAAHRIRKRLKGLIRDEIRQTVENEEDVEEEVRYLIQLFGR